MEIPSVEIRCRSRLWFWYKQCRECWDKLSRQIVKEPYKDNASNESKLERLTDVMSIQIQELCSLYISLEVLVRK